MNRSAVRTMLVIFGMFVLMTVYSPIHASLADGSSPETGHLVVASISLVLSLYGYYLWAQLKGRHWAWMLLGLTSPLGTVPIALLSDRSR